MTTSLTVHEGVGRILNELSQASSAIDWAPWEQLPGVIGQANAVFAVGNGRSGLALRMAAMRLMHLGRTVHVVGETTTPAIGPGDLLLAVSGSGSTKTVVNAAETAAQQDAAVVAITANPSSQLARIATHVLHLPAPEKTDRAGDRSQQYAGTLFEQLVLVLLDAVFQALWLSSGVAADELYKRHANLG